MVQGQIRRYRQISLNRPDPIPFMTVSVDTSGRVYDDFNRVRPYFVVSTTNLSCDKFGDSDGTEEVDVVNL